MPYGREMLEASWEWNWDTHPIYKIMREDTIDLDALSPLFDGVQLPVSDFEQECSVYRRSAKTD